MNPPRRAIATLVMLTWSVAAAHGSGRWPGAIVWKKDSHPQGEKISARQLLQFATKTSVPSYQNDERILKFTGTGIFDLRIDPSTGETTGIHIFKSTGHYELDVAAVKALINWRFTPGTLVRAVFPMSFEHTKIRQSVTPEEFLRPGL